MTELLDQLVSCEVRGCDWRGTMRIDLTFQMVYRASFNKTRLIEPRDREKIMAEVAKHMRTVGFDTEPMGSSWGVLKP